jgi:hypothetical protein
LLESVSVDARSTVPPGTAASAAEDADDRFEPVSAVSPLPVVVEPVVELDVVLLDVVELLAAWCVACLACERLCRFAAIAGAAPPSASIATAPELATILVMLCVTAFPFSRLPDTRSIGAGAKMAVRPA